MRFLLVTCLSSKLVVWECLDRELVAGDVAVLDNDPFTALFRHPAKGERSLIQSDFLALVVIADANGQHWANYQVVARELEVSPSA